MSHNNNKDTADGLNELRSRIWQGSIPLQIALSPLDCRTYEDSIPYMVRVSCLHPTSFTLLTHERRSSVHASPTSRFCSRDFTPSSLQH